MSSDRDRDEVRSSSLLDALEHLEAVSFVASRQRYTDAGQLAKTIATNAYESGIPEPALQRLLGILTKNNKLDQGTITTLVKNLYPLESVPSKLVTQVVCCLGPTKNKPSSATQVLLLRWLILVYDILEDRSHLPKLYSVLFNHLDMISLRKPLCHLLSFLTRRKHVKPFRIQALMELLVSSGGDDKEIITLLRVFKNYCPNLIVGEPGRKGLFFKHPDLEWTSHVRQLQQNNLERLNTAKSAGFHVVRRGLGKRSKMEVIVPHVQTSRVSYNRTPLEELRGVDHFIERLDKIELPNQIISTIGDGLSQKYMFLVGPEPANRRLDDWLQSFLSDQLLYAQDFDDEGVESLGYVLGLAVDYARYSKVIPERFISFFKSYLPLWNGDDNREGMLNLLEYLANEDYESLRTDILLPLEAALLDNAVRSRVTLLDFYSSLIRQWGVKLRSQPFSRRESVPLGHLVSHAEVLALSILESPTPTQQTFEIGKEYKPGIQSVMEFYCTLADVFSYASSNGRIRLTIPLAPTVYSIVFTPVNSVISTMSSVLASYKSSFEASLTSEVLQGPNSADSLYPTQLVGQFNGYIMDICNLLWRNRGLNGDDPNALSCLIPAPTINALTQYVRETHENLRRRNRDAAFSYTVASAFSLGHHAALCNMSASCFAGIEKDNNIGDDQPRLRKPVTQKALSALEKEGGVKMSWQDYRVQMLNWLDAIGTGGIGNLMRSTMKALRKV